MMIPNKVVLNRSESIERSSNRAEVLDKFSIKVGILTVPWEIMTQRKETVEE